ncbi:hypothetical protein FOC4_g10004685 [Fusarium odoratissimum]|uniref:Uncharacterized protein n=1 Tax=Fusarium oxysporum f. sp. cubense (strain race 4) TaxID=2502994 RepID=N1S5D1_FUSC4|nr:hypothetical protein FOC4_g10004685 [Fusarium odoratissimum]
MGLIAKLKFKLRKRLAQGTAESVALGILGLVSLERVCKVSRPIVRDLHCMSWYERGSYHCIQCRTCTLVRAATPTQPGL